MLSMHRIRAVASIVGSSAALLAVGAVLLYIAEWDSPTRWFLSGSLLFGLVGAGLLRSRYRRSAAEVKRLSILGKP
jgi:hypothetical protein